MTLTQLCRTLSGLRSTPPTFRMSYSNAMQKIHVCDVISWRHFGSAPEGSPKSRDPSDATANDR